MLQLENKSCCSSSNSDSTNKRIKIKPKIKVSNQSDALSLNGKEKPCCCGGSEKCSTELITQYDKNDQWIIGEVKTDVGTVPQVSTQLDFSDIYGAWKVRWGIDRMNYKVNPGVYAVGTPDKDSAVLVTANYKLTFDTLRKELAELNAWILVLDTKGVNVWCAAGKGTFGTKELVNRIKRVNLHKIVSHRTLIVPQLGAPGVSAHEITRETGFKIVYGPVRANDITAFIKSGMKATGEMREVKFDLVDRLVLTPVEFLSTFKLSMIVFGILFLINLIAVNPFGIIDFYSYMGAIVAGTVITPVLLPWIPGRAFAWKGWLVGFLWTVAVFLMNGWNISPFKELGYFLVLPSISAYYAMNFTGSSTYTSFSGVLKEMKIAVPAIIGSIGLGSILLLIHSFVKF